MFLLNSPYGKDEVWEKLPVEVQKQIIDKKLKFYVIDATKIADEVGLRGRINVTMQTAFFLISGVVPEAKALELIKQSIEDTYGNKGRDVVEMNMKAVEVDPLAHREGRRTREGDRATCTWPTRCPRRPPRSCRTVTAEIIANRGEDLPVSKLPDDGTWPTATTQCEKRNIAEEIPVWDPDTCIQCGECSLVCPHAVIRMKIYDPAKLAGAPPTFKSTEAKGAEFKGQKFTPAGLRRSTARAAACASAPAPPTRRTPRARRRPQGDQHVAPDPAARRPSRRTGSSSSGCPRWTRS